MIYALVLVGTEMEQMEMEPVSWFVTYSDRCLVDIDEKEASKKTEFKTNV